MAIRNSDGSIILTTSVDQSGLKKSMSGIKGTAGKAASAIKTSLLAIGAATVAATVAITKMSISAYAEFEQLAGGTELLFGKAAKTVMKNAQEAFATVQMSQNEYLKQVNGFAVGLKTALGGNEEAAANLAHKIIVAEADIVAATGETQENVQNAFNGIMRSNFTMLDNLKLGINPTKEGFQEVIDKVNAWNAANGKATKYQMGNLAHMQAALVDYVEMQGLAGYATAEAAGTIQGSTAMMKAAWQNVLTAIAGGGDLEVAIDNLVSSIGIFFQNILPVVQRSIQGIGKLIEQVAPALVQNVVSALIKSIPSLLNAIYQMIIGLAKGIWDGIMALFSGSGGASSAIQTSISNTASGAQDIGSAFDAAGAAVDNAGGSMGNLGKATKAAGKEAKKTLAAFDDLSILSSAASSGTGGGGSGGSGGSGTPSNIGGVGSAGGTPTATSVMSMTNNSPLNGGMFDKILDALNPIKDIFMSGFWEGFEGADFTPIVTSLQSIWRSLSDIFTNPQLLSAMANWGATLLNSIGQVTGSAVSVGVSIVTALVGGIADALERNKTLITSKLTSLFTINSESFSMVGDLHVALADIVSVIKGQNGQQIVSSFAGIFISASLNVLELGSKIGRDFIDIVSKPIINNKDKIKKALDGAFGVAGTVLKTVEDTVTKTGDKLNEVYDSKFQPFFSDIGNGLSTLSGAFLDTFNTYMLPAFQNFANNFSATVSEHFQPAINAFIELWGAVAELIQTLWNSVLVPFGTWLIEVFGPIFTAVFEPIGRIFNAVFGAMSDILNGFFTAIKGLIEFITGVFKGDWEKAWNGIKNIFDGIWTAIEGTLKAIGATIEEVFTLAWNAVVLVWDAAIGFFEGIWEGIKLAFSAVGQFFSDVFTGAWEGIKLAWSGVVTWFSDLWTSIKDVFSSVGTWFSDIFDEAWSGIKNVFAPVSTFFTNVWNSIKSVFSNVATWFKEIFSDAWSGVIGVFSSAGEIFNEIVNGVVTVFKEIVNALIDGINWVIAKPFEGLNGVLNTIQHISVVGVEPFDWLTWRCPVPKIPHLATGAVIPPNKEFLAVLGDQKHGTNIEAPAALIKQMAKEAIAESGYTGQAMREEHYYLSETELMSVIYRLVKGGERLQGDSLVSGGAY